MSRDVPCSTHAETTILGAILVDQTALADAAALEPEDFYLSSHQVIFRTMRTMMDEPIDLITLTDRMRREKTLDTIGETPVAYLAGLSEDMPRHPAIKRYVEIVKEKSTLRSLIALCRQSITAAHGLEPSVEIGRTLYTELTKLFNGKKPK